MWVSEVSMVVGRLDVWHIVLSFPKRLNDHACTNDMDTKNAEQAKEIFVVCLQVFICVLNSSFPQNKVKSPLKPRTMFYWPKSDKKSEKSAAW